MRRAVFIILLLLPMFAFAQDETQEELDIEELRQRILGEAPDSFLKFSLADAEVSFFLTGSWKGQLQGNLGLAFSPLGTNFSSPETPLLFKQEIDLSLSLWINDKWFVEADFQDESRLNTYSAGYQGFPGDYFQYAVIGNTGLDFPTFPYLDLGGSSASSFGIYSRFGSENLTFHAIVRYDTASREERIFLGGRERTFSDIQVQNSVRGVSFVLPDENIDSQILIFIEDENGNLSDTNGLRWRLLLPGEYAASRIMGILELGIKPEGMIAVNYIKETEQPWINSMGSSYTDIADENKYLYTVWQWFGDSINPGNYPQCGNRNESSSIPGEFLIDNIPALVIYEPGTFSPFERRNRYEAPSNISQEAFLIRPSSGANINGYELVLSETGSGIFFSDNQLTMSGNPLYDIAGERVVFELLPAGSSIGRRHPESLWPLVKDFSPEIYFPSTGVFTGDVALRFISYNSSSGFYIGTDVIPGSVQVWRGGFQDTGFNYNSLTGEVVIQGSAGLNELIRITYLKRNEGMRSGSIAAGFGAVFNKDASPFSAQAALGIRWNITEDSYTVENQSNMGIAGFSARAAWDYDYLKAHVTGGFTYVMTDTTDLFRAAGMEGNETILALPAQSAFISNPPSSEILKEFNLIAANRANLIYRNYFNSSILGSGLMPIDWNTPVISGLSGPYPAMDNQIKVQIITLEFYLDSNENWTGFQVPVIDSPLVFSHAEEIEIPFRFYDLNINTPDDFKLIVQIGSLSGSELSFIENPELIWEKSLFPDDTDPGSDYFIAGDYRIARFKLTDSDRLRLGNAKYLRIIAVYDGIEEINGRILFAPPIIRGSSFRAVTFIDNIISAAVDFESSVNRVSVVETMDNSLALTFPDIINRLHPFMETQRVLKIEWDNMETGFSAGADGRIGELPLTDYREISFFVKTNQSGIDQTLDFIIAAGPDSVSNPLLKAQIPISAFTVGQWSKVTIRYQGGNTGVFINGNLTNADFIYNSFVIHDDIFSGRSNYIALLVTPGISSSIDSGIIYIDEIILEDAISAYRFNVGSSFEYRRQGTLFSIGSIPVLADFSFLSVFDSETNIYSSFEVAGGENIVSGGIAGRARMQFSLFDIKMTGNIFLSASGNIFNWSADHEISRTIAAFTVRETFSASSQSGTVRHGLNLSYSDNFSARFDADAFFDFSKLRQRWFLSSGYKSKNEYIPDILINTEAVWVKQNPVLNEDKNYAELWLETFKPLFPDTGSGADSRKTQTQIVITQSTKPVGAVITFNGMTNFTKINNISASESSVYLDIPVSNEKLNMNFRAGRLFKSHIYYFSESAIDDGRIFFESLGDFLPFWRYFPGYSLFTADLNLPMDNLYENSFSSGLLFYSSFNDSFNVRIILPPSYNYSAFFIPSRISLMIDRLLEQKMDTRTDTLNLGGSLGFSAINMFGAMGYAPLFSFYHSDEYQHAIDISFSIPRHEETTWRIRSIINAGFRGFTGGMLNFINTFSVHSNGYWHESFIAGWETPTEKSMLSVIYDWIAFSAGNQESWPYLSSLFSLKYEQLRRESLELTFDKTGDHLRMSITAGHEEIVRVLGRINFTSFIKLRLNSNFQTDTFNFDVLLGTSLRLFF